MSAGFELAGLAAGYPGRPLFAGLSLPPVAPGRIIAVVGPNAAGKSTLLRAVAGLHPATGSVLLDGRRLDRMPSRERLRLAAYLPQALPQPTSLVAYEALLSALRAGGRGAGPAGRTESMIQDTLAELGLRELALSRIDRMSGGQRQMMGLAQVMVREPRLLLLDEPTSALDLRWQLRLLDSVAASCARRGAVALIALHDLNLALRFCNPVIVLGPGGEVTIGEPAALIDAALLRRVWGVEARIERCSLGHPLVLADRALDDDADKNKGRPS